MLELNALVTYNYDLCGGFEICIGHEHDQKMGHETHAKRWNTSKRPFLKEERKTSQETSTWLHTWAFGIEAYGKGLYRGLDASKGHEIDEETTKKYFKYMKEDLDASLDCGKNNGISIDHSLGLNEGLGCGLDLNKAFGNLHGLAWVQEAMEGDQDQVGDNSKSKEVWRSNEVWKKEDMCLANNQNRIGLLYIS